MKAQSLIWMMKLKFQLFNFQHFHGNRWRFIRSKRTKRKTERKRKSSCKWKYYLLILNKPYLSISIIMVLIKFDKNGNIQKTLESPNPSFRLYFLLPKFFHYRLTLRRSYRNVSLSWWPSCQATPPSTFIYSSSYVTTRQIYLYSKIQR